PLTSGAGHLLPLEDGKVWYNGPVVEYKDNGPRVNLYSLLDSRPGYFSAGNMFSDVLVHRRAFRGIPGSPDQILKDLVEFSQRDDELVTPSHRSSYGLGGVNREILYTYDGMNYQPLKSVLKTGLPIRSYAIYPADVKGKTRVVVSPEKFLVESVTEFYLRSN